MVKYCVIISPDSTMIHLESIQWGFLTFLVADGFLPVTIESE